MANVTGPTGRLPGDTRQPPTGAMCDEHPNVSAALRVTGETDSMGSEEHDLCEACYRQMCDAEKTRSTAGCCEWCNTDKPKLHPQRDFEEGLAGPVYHVCNDCIRKQNEYIEKHY